MNSNSQWTDQDLLTLFATIADQISTALGGLDDWGPSGLKVGQYRSDLAADAAALGLLDEAGLGVLSEESGLRRGDAGVVVVVDPVDGSTNAAKGIPWFATSLCAVDTDGPRVSLVRNLASSVTFTAIRGGGAFRNGHPIAPNSQCRTLGEAVVGLSGMPPRHLGWRQFRALGAAALDLCAVASGTLDAFIDCSPSAHGSWDYLGGLLVCREAGAVVADAEDRELVTLVHGDRRTPVAGATPEVFAETLAARKSFL